MTSITTTITTTATTTSTTTTTTKSNIIDTTAITAATATRYSVKLYLVFSVLYHNINVFLQVPTCCGTIYYNLLVGRVQED